jgi:hypothetical protein
MLLLARWFLSPWWRRFVQEPHGVTSQRTAFFIVTAVRTCNLTLTYYLLSVDVCECFGNVFFGLSSHRTMAAGMNAVETNPYLLSGLAHNCCMCTVSKISAFMCLPDNYLSHYVNCKRLDLIFSTWRDPERLAGDLVEHASFSPQ